MHDSTPTSHRSTSGDPAAADAGALTVYFDGACPLCRREVKFYRGRDDAGSIDWVDVAGGESEYVAPDLSRDDALSRFHVRLPGWISIVHAGDGPCQGSCGFNGGCHIRKRRDYRAAMTG